MDYYKWINYYKRSLSDGIRADINIDDHKFWFELGDFHVTNNKLDIRNNTDLLNKVNLLIDAAEARLNKTANIDRGSDQWKRINESDLLVAPFRLMAKPDRLVYSDRKMRLPFWYWIKVNRKGHLSVPDECFPVLQRKYLEPHADDRVDYTFSSVDKVDCATSIGKEEISSLEEYYEYINQVFVAVTGQEIEKYEIEDLIKVNNAIILLPDEEIPASEAIISLYNSILKQEHVSKCLKDLLNVKNSKEKSPVKTEDLMKVNSHHLGQMSGDFPLSFSQRISLYTWLQSEGKVFAINGPPGTGKTTLLQSVVASMVVESALKGKQPPIILACSTNNQAVTNINESFSKSSAENGLTGRWIPDFQGYATYLPSNSKDESELNGINYKKVNGDGTFKSLETIDYVNKAREYFLQKSSQYLNQPFVDIKGVLKRLTDELNFVQDSVTKAQTCWSAYLNKEVFFRESYPVKDEKRYWENDLLNEKAFQEDIDVLTELEQSVLSYYRNEPFLRKLFCALNFRKVIESRQSELRSILRGSFIADQAKSCFRVKEITDEIDKKIADANTIISAINEWKSAKLNLSAKGNPPRTEGEYLQKHDASQSGYFYDELDVDVRNKAFHLAIHYWEAKWLNQVADDLLNDDFNKKGSNPVKKRWNRQAMLTPCFVSTFYMAPKFFTFMEFLSMNDNGKKNFDNKPLFDFIDLLIVDEAGQVTPEVGVATFSLAKKALVVGDIKQIEPVWNITSRIDIGNLKGTGLIKDYDDTTFEEIYDPKGFLASTGNIMKMAQNGCMYRESGSSEKGLMLTEHRRCYDEIINYCSHLAYAGKLKPMRGPAKNVLFPPMQLIHVEGKSSVKGSSRQNLSEVNAIVQWMITNKSAIESRYKTPIESAVGIITPFTGQKVQLLNALRNSGFSVSGMKIGTVHALQGAERPIVLFSMVYGEGDTGTMFFDRDNKPNMLNVAVSRAKDNFIVFANSKILDRKAKSPSGILRNYFVE